jgi:KaiC/GvpD/RAD55 family RecA-like ATPase
MSKRRDETKRDTRKRNCSRKIKRRTVRHDRYAVLVRSSVQFKSSQITEETKKGIVELSQRGLNMSCLRLCVLVREVRVWMDPRLMVGVLFRYMPFLVLV